MRCEICGFEQYDNPDLVTERSFVPDYNINCCTRCANKICLSSVDCESLNEYRVITDVSAMVESCLAVSDRPQLDAAIYAMKELSRQRITLWHKANREVHNLVQRLKDESDES